MLARSYQSSVGGREEAFFVNVAVSNLKNVAIVYASRYASAGIFDVECVERLLGGGATSEDMDTESNRSVEIICNELFKYKCRARVMVGGETTLFFFPLTCFDLFSILSFSFSICDRRGGIKEDTEQAVAA